MKNNLITTMFLLAIIWSAMAIIESFPSYRPVEDQLNDTIKTSSPFKDTTTIKTDSVTVTGFVAADWKGLPGSAAPETLKVWSSPMQIKRKIDAIIRFGKDSTVHFYIYGLKAGSLYTIKVVHSIKEK